MSRAGWVLVALTPVLAFAQGSPQPEDQQPRVIVVPVPSDAPADAVLDAGVPEQIEAPPPAPPPEPPVNNPPPPTPPADTPVRNDQPPPIVPVDNPEGAPVPVGAMLDGHPREGSFLSGPGSMFFVVHHTLMGGLGVLAATMVPRVFRAFSNDPTCNVLGQDNCALNGDARIAYLVGALVGGGIGFASASTWQFFNWMNTTTATFGLINSIIGAMFAIGATNLVTQDPNPISWMGLVGALGGAWLTAVIGGGDMSVNKGLLITTGAVWAAIYASLILGIFATTGGNSDLRAGFDTVLIMPALGATALAIATLKFNPSTEQIIRANIFGGGVGIAVLLLSALLVPHQFNSPIPYALAGLTAAGAQTLVSLLWVDSVNAPPAPANTSGPSGLSYLYHDPEKDKPYSRVWW